VLACLVRRIGKFHAPGLHPAPGQDLGFDHDRSTDLLGGLSGLVGGGAEAVFGDRNARPLDDPARLVLIEAHLCG
jgi:hypothetical protein